MAAKGWKLARGRTWRGKLEEERPNHGKTVPIPPRMQKRFGRGTMLIPRPLDVDTVMRLAKKGKLITQSQIRDELAQVPQLCAQNRPDGGARPVNSLIF